MYGFTLILTLAVVGGAIAYIGDRLGMNVGRKKLTLFGLRPKHTSILVTIVTGVLIATASIVVLSIASQDVRTALFNMKEIQEELRGLQRDFAEMRRQRDAAQTELQEAESRLALVEESYAQITAELELAQQSVEALKEERAFLEAEVAELMVTAEQLSWLYDLVETAFGQIRSADIAFYASEVILSTVIEKGLSRAEVRAALEDFLREVDDVAYRRSARADGEPYRAIFLPPGVLDLVVEDVLLAPGNVIVRAVSEANSIPGGTRPCLPGKLPRSDGLFPRDGIGRRHLGSPQRHGNRPGHPAAFEPSQQRSPQCRSSPEPRTAGCGSAPRQLLLRCHRSFPGYKAAGGNPFGGGGGLLALHQPGAALPGDVPLEENPSPYLAGISLPLWKTSCRNHPCSVV